MRFLVTSLPLVFLIFVVNLAHASTSKMEIFKDANYSSPSLNFSVSDQIYVRVESDNPGETKKELKLRDNLYREISTFGFLRDDSSPFIYKVSFSAPNALGYYSLEATIESPGLVDKLVQTIQVGEVSSAQIKTDISTQVNTGSKQKSSVTLLPSSQPKKPEVLATEGAQLKIPSTPTPKVFPTSIPASQPLILRFFAGIGNFFVVIFKFFFRF